MRFGYYESLGYLVVGLLGYLDEFYFRVGW